MATALWVGLGGLLGTLARFYLGSYITARTGGAFPLGTFLINVSGSLLLGILASAGARLGPIPPHLRLALTVGFCGGYTTFSTWSLETVRLLDTGSYLLAAFNVAGSAAAGIAGAWIGLVIGRWL